MSKPSWSEKLKNLTPKQKQYLVLGAVGFVLLVLVVGSVSLVENSAPLLPQQQATKTAVPKNIAVPGQQVDPRDVWMSQSSSRFQEMENTLRELRQKLDAAESGQNAPQRVGGVDPAHIELPKLPPLNPPPMDQTQVQMPPPPPPLPQLPARVEPEIGFTSFEISSKPEVEKQKPQSEGAKTYIPSGSFARAVLLGGFDAPAGGQAQNNPLPILLKIQDNAFLPNRYRAKVRDCHIVGQGYGDISSERAYIRTEALSCVLKNGEVVDAPMKGYIVGEDGKAGMRGRLVSKQGQVLANALATGIISGFGQGLQQASMSYGTSAFGQVATVDPSQRVQAGIGSGIGRALDRMSQYYITLAEKMFPVIEIDAMREIDVVITKGITLGMGSAGGSEDEYSEIWKRGRQIQRKPLNVMEEN